MIQTFSLGNKRNLNLKKVLWKKKKRQQQNGYVLMFALFMLFSLSLLFLAVEGCIAASYSAACKRSNAFYSALATQNKVVEGEYEAH